MKTQKVVISAMLVALSAVIAMYSPKIPLGMFTATFASHVPTIIAMFISPAVAALTVVGSVLGFAVAFPGMPYVPVRAATHIIFAVVGAIMIQRKVRIPIVILVTLILHPLAEVWSVNLFELFFPNIKVKLPAGVSFKNAMEVIVGVGTAIHHMIDFAISLAILGALSKSKAMKNFTSFRF